ncbi:Tryptophanyl-tRNA synthetase [hydrothermal vent metagenome]|uniref:tryptophan--tRNA ligase n=1 Tax=hydrothermal vent metagenome TaxID=652676 RepID=A0A3B1C7A8_9ZZZZ
MSKKRVLSGMQTSGKLHIGNLLGALNNWVRMQQEYDCFYFAADWHALSSNYEETSQLKENILDLGINWLSAGLDPEKATLFIQSLIPEHAVLHTLFSMITPLPWLERVPSYKEKMEQVQNRDLHTYGFLGYPVLQAADIALYKADFVPVGIDQLPHLELTREIVRRFHDIYGKKVFVEPQAKMSQVPKLPGTDGRKMSKSYNNAIYLSDSAEEIGKKIQNIVTDPARVRKSDPGDPAKCVAYSFHEVFSTAEENEVTQKECKSASRGCVDCKKGLAKNLLHSLEPLMEQRSYWSQRPGDVLNILQEGTGKAKQVAEETLSQAEAAMNIDVRSMFTRAYSS